MSIRTLTLTASVSAATHARMDAFLRQQRELYNAALEERIDRYRKTGEGVSLYDQQRSLTEIRRDDEDFNRFPVGPQRTALTRLDRAFRAFFRRLKMGEKPGFPRFKSRFRPIRSLDVPNPLIRNGSLYIKGIGRLKLSGRLPERSTIQTARVVRTPLRIAVMLVAEVEDRPRAPDEPIGIDVGIARRATLSTGETVEPVHLDRRELRRRQRALSRARRGSVSRAKRRETLSREWARISLRERDALHRISASVVSRHNRIAVEDLEIANMVRHPTLARSISEQQWGRLVQMLTYKAESAGGEVIRVDPRNTSTDCSACGHRRKLTLSTRTYRCERCGLDINRDTNAARNVLSRGIAAAGWEVSAHRERSPGASEGALVLPNVAAIAGQDAERYAAQFNESCMQVPVSG